MLGCREQRKVGGKRNVGTKRKELEFFKVGTTGDEYRRLPADVCVMKDSSGLARCRKMRLKDGVKGVLTGARGGTDLSHRLSHAERRRRFPASAGRMDPIPADARYLRLPYRSPCGGRSWEEGWRRRCLSF